MSNREQQHRILYVTPSAINRKALQSVFHATKYKVIYGMNVDHAVAFCIDNGVSAIVLDSTFLTEQDYFGVQTLKSICSGVPVLLLADNHDEKIPQGVDAIAGTPTLVLQELHRLLGI